MDGQIANSDNWDTPPSTEGGLSNVVFGYTNISSILLPSEGDSAVGVYNITFLDPERPEYTFSSDSPETPTFLYLGGGLTVQDSPNSVSFDHTVHFLLGPDTHVLDIGSGTTVNVDGDARELTEMEGADPVYDASIEKAGSGTLVLRGQSTFRGGLSVTGGTLIIGADSIAEYEGDSMIGVTSGPVGTGTLKLYNGTTLGVTEGGSFTLHNLIDLDCTPCSSITIELACADSLTLTGNISGASQLVQTGGGTLTLSGNNNFTGGVTVSNGKLLLGSDSAVGTGTLKLEAGTTLGLADNNSYCLNNLIDLGCSGGLVNIAINGCGELALYGQISGSGGILKKGDGTLVLDNGNNTFSGSVTVTRGTLVIGSSSYTEAIYDGEYYIGQQIVSGPVGTETLKFEANCTIPTLALADNGCYILHNNIDLGCFTGTVKIDTGCGDLTLAGYITGTAGITKVGDGDLTLEGNNEFYGDFKVEGGTVNAETDRALGYGLLAFCSSSGAIVNFNSDHPTISGLSGYSCEDLINLNGDCWPAQLTIVQDVNTAFAGVIAGEGSVIKDGCGDLTLSGQSTFTGGFTVRQGTLIIASSSVLSEVEVDGFMEGGDEYAIESGPVGTGTLKLESGTTLSVADNGSYDLHNMIDLGCSGGLVKIAVASCGELSLYGQISGSATIVKKGDGTLALYNGDNDFTGGVTVMRGTLVLGDSSVGDYVEGDLVGVLSGPVGIDTLKFEANCTIPVLALADNGCYELHNNIDLGCFAGTVKIDTGCGDLTLYGSISGTAGITKAGSGTLTLEGENDMDGDFYVSAGTVNANSDYALGDGVLKFGTAGGATVNFNSVYPAINGLEGSSSTDTINLNGGSEPLELLIEQDKTSTFAGVITGNGSIYLAGCGNLTLSGQSTFTAGFTIANGATLTLAGSSHTNGTAVDYSPIGTGDLNMEDNAKLSAFGSGITLLNDVFLDGAPGATQNFFVDSGSEFTIGNGSLGTISGNGRLNKTGMGTLTLLTANTYTGGTSIGGGVLAVGNPGALGTGTVTIAGGALKLTNGLTNISNPLDFSLGGGTLTGNWVFTTPQAFGTGVTLSPGNSPGTMTFTDLTVTNGFSEIVEFNAASGAAGTVSDLFSGTGTLDLSAVSAGGYTLHLISLLPDNSPGEISGLTAPTSWSIFQFSTITGFLADNSQFIFDKNGFVGGGTFALTLSGTAGLGQNLTLNFTPVPEPSTYALLALGLGTTGIAAWRKRRRSA